ncbi:Mediator of RNA polymerase II transcription subunit 24 [Chamberlinius hualienensis]
MDTSKTSSIKSLLLRAWRERWTDVQWGINIKQVLPRGVSGDVYNLADCILQQALIGPGPNHLVLSYLKHCLSARLVSCGAILQSISKYQSFHKPHCILSLLDLLKSFQSRISCYGNDEECLVLCVAMLSCVLWLFSCIHQSLLKVAELKQSPEYFSVIEKACDSLKSFSDAIFFRALLYVGRHEDIGTYIQLVQKLKEVEMQLAATQVSNLPKDSIEGIIKAFSNLDEVSLHPESYRRSQMLVPSLNGMLTLEAILHPTNDVNSLVDQLILLQKLQNLTWSRLYCELIRSCLMGFIDCSGGADELKWASFTFLKVPLIIVKINSIVHGDVRDTEPTTDLCEGLEELLGYIPLLDLADSKCNCDCIQYLLNEFYSKTGLLSEDQAKNIIQRRHAEGQKPSTRIPELQKAQPGSAELILRAEPTVSSILKTLDADYSKNQDALLGVLCHMMSGKSFELIVAAAAATGKLQSFAVKLIKFNEFSKQISGETSKTPQTRALLFDITFLMLCHIAQQYGSDVVTSNGETKDSFFEQWVTECLGEGGRCKSPDLILQRSDPVKVDILLSQFSSSDSDIKTNLVIWHEVCINAPAAVKEVLLAWEGGCITKEGVKAILDNIKSRMCCLPVCISAWLCSYISIVHHDHHLKPMSMLQEFQKLLTADNPSLNEAGSSSSGNAPESAGQYYKERSSLMIAIIKRMIYDMHPPFASQVKLKSGPLPHAVASTSSINEILEGVFNTIHTKNWLDLKSTHMLESLLHVGGPQWFVTTLIKMGFGFSRVEFIENSVDLLFAIFQIDIELCTLALILNCLTMILYNDNKMEMLIEPRGTELARLTTMCLFSALQAKQSQKASANAKKKVTRHSRRDLDLEEMAELIDFRTVGKSGTLTVGNDIDDLPRGISGDQQNVLNPLEPLSKAAAELFRMFYSVVNDPTLSQRTQFVVRFLEQTVICGKDYAKMILQYMPLGMVSRLLKCLPRMFTTERLLSLSDMETAVGRKKTAKVLVQLQNTIARS